LRAEEEALAIISSEDDEIPALVKPAFSLEVASAESEEEEEDYEIIE